MSKSHRILVTGAAGFIGSHIVDALLDRDDVERVVGLDDLSNGYRVNLEQAQQSPRFQFVEGSITDSDLCRELTAGVSHVCHQAALGSVPRSIEDPIRTHEANALGTLRVFEACRQNSVGRIVYAASSSTYGDSTQLPKREGEEGKPLSPYAVTKLVNELYARVYASVYGQRAIGLRYFNVFGPRQSPKGAYAAVIPLFVKSILDEGRVYINGDGETSRDFTYVDNVVRANLLALFGEVNSGPDAVYNIAAGGRTTLNELADYIADGLGLTSIEKVYRPERPGDVRHSFADVTRARRDLGYAPEIDVRRGIGLLVRDRAVALAPGAHAPSPHDAK